MVHFISFYVIDQYKGVPIPEYHDIGTAFTPMSGYSKRYLPVKRSYQSCHFHANNHFVSNRFRFEPFQLGLNHCFVRYYFVIKASLFDSMVEEADDGALMPLQVQQKRSGKNNKKKQNRKQFRQSLSFLG